jgi:hypothetical protein
MTSVLLSYVDNDEVAVRVSCELTDNGPCVPVQVVATRFGLQEATVILVDTSSNYILFPTEGLFFVDPTVEYRVTGSKPPAARLGDARPAFVSLAAFNIGNGGACVAQSPRGAGSARPKASVVSPPAKVCV